MPYFTCKNNSLYYREQGAGPLLLILPGNTASSAAHQQDLDRFSPNFRTAALDFLGTGLSDRIDPWPVDWWREGADQAAALIAHLGYESAVLLGTSGGAVTALLTAIHHPEKVRAVIADSFPEHFSSEMAENNVVRERREPVEEQIRFWQYMHGEDWQDVVDADTRMITGFAGIGGDCFAGELPEVRCRVLITGSREDTHIPRIEEQYRSMGRQIPQCEVFLNDTGQHPLIWSEPDVFYQLADAFLKPFASRHGEA